ncbi:MAG: hypothetical protein KAS32_14180 [Candidatus Peribacteraceae bacterium]|nr:hypothetical protein [Candidatus Peribacteraceae bacterium]
MLNFKPVFIEANDLDDAWHQLLWNLHEYGRRYPVTSGSHAGQDRIAFDYVAGIIKDPHKRPLTPRMPHGLGIPGPIDRGDEQIDDYFAKYLMFSDFEDEEEEKNNEYKYATWIAGDGDHDKTDLCSYSQVNWIIDHFKKHGYGNDHCYITIGNPDTNQNYDRPFMVCNECEHVNVKDIRLDVCEECGSKNIEIDDTIRGTSPCLRGLDFRIVDGYLTTHVVYRSWDLWGGFPENMGGFTLLNEHIAGELGVSPGPLTFSCKSLHAYSHHVDIIAKRLRKD